MSAGASANGPPEYVGSLDGVRALAIAAVLAFHAEIPGVSGGYLGVDVFFVLSGYLITSLLLGEGVRTGEINVAGFFGRRFRRLFPGLAAMTLATMALAALVAPDAVASTWQDLRAATFGSMNWWLVLHRQSYFEAFGRPELLQHTWSLAVEAQFYLLWPFVLITAARAGGARAVGFAAAGLAFASGVATFTIANAPDFQSNAAQSRFYYGTDTRAAGLLIGAMLAAWWPVRSAVSTRRGRAAREIGAVVAFAGLALLFHWVSRSDRIAYEIGFMAASVCAAALIGCVARPGIWSAAMLGTAPARWLGTRSYSIYLWHWPIFQLLRPGYEVPFDPVLGNVLRLAVTFAVAELSFRLVEKPFRSFRISTLVSLLVRGDMATMSALCACLFCAVVAGGLIDAMASQTSRAAEAANVALLQPPALKPRTAQTATPRRVVHRVAAAAPLARPTRTPLPSVASPVVRAVPVRLASVVMARTPSFELKDTTLLGDSIMLASSRAIASRFRVVNVNAAVGRQADTLANVVATLQAEHKLTPIVILDVGNNGTVDTSTLEAMLDDLKSCEHVVVVNAHLPRPWEYEANNVVARVAPKYKNVVVADWYDAAAGHDSEYFGEDRVHPNQAGARAYVATIIDALEAATARASVKAIVALPLRDLASDEASAATPDGLGERRPRGMTEPFDRTGPAWEKRPTSSSIKPSGARIARASARS